MSMYCFLCAYSLHLPSRSAKRPSHNHIRAYLEITPQNTDDQYVQNYFLLYLQAVKSAGYILQIRRLKDVRDQ